MVGWHAYAYRTDCYVMKTLFEKEVTFREELAKQQAKANYVKAHLAGKTEEAQADMARLALLGNNAKKQLQRRPQKRKVCKFYDTKFSWDNLEVR